MLSASKFCKKKYNFDMLQIFHIYFNKWYPKYKVNSAISFDFYMSNYSKNNCWQRKSAIYTIDFFNTSHVSMCFWHQDEEIIF